MYTIPSRVLCFLQFSHYMRLLSKRTFYSALNYNPSFVSRNVRVLISGIGFHSLLSRKIAISIYDHNVILKTNFSKKNAIATQKKMAKSQKHRQRNTSTACITQSCIQKKKNKQEKKRQDVSQDLFRVAKVNESESTADSEGYTHTCVCDAARFSQTTRQIRL